jgi:hypothetical protein
VTDAIVFGDAVVVVVVDVVGSSWPMLYAIWSRI